MPIILPPHGVAVNDIGVLTRDELNSLLESWLIDLQSERKSPQTRKTYRDGVRGFLAWCDRTGTPPALDRRTVTAWIADLLDGGAEAATARARQLAVRRFSAWLAAEGEIERDALYGLRPPRLDNKVVDSLTDDELTRLVAACKGREFVDRRDEAAVRLLAATGLRAEELLGMTVTDTRIRDGFVVVRRGKGGKGRTVAFGPVVAASLDRYVRARRSHRLAGTDVFWLGDRGKGLGYHGLRVTLLRRAEAAKVDGFHVHRLRHTAASRWLDKGGTESGLMATAGWSSRAMIDRYVKSTSERRAAEEAKRLQLDDI